MGTYYTWIRSLSGFASFEESASGASEGRSSFVSFRLSPASLHLNETVLGVGARE